MRYGSAKLLALFMLAVGCSSPESASDDMDQSSLAPDLTGAQTTPDLADVDGSPSTPDLANSLVAVCTGAPVEACSIVNGTGSEGGTCSAGVWSPWGPCSVTSCNAGYLQVGNACEKVTGTTYYIDPGGTDGAARDGSAGSPWRSLAYACGRVTSAGDLIHVNAGTYPESSQCALGRGVSIEGEGPTSIISSSYVGSKTDALIVMTSPTAAPVDGHQSISNLKLSGNSLTGKSAVFVSFRNNVSIHHCTVADFDQRGITFASNDGYPNPPTVAYATGNSIHDCTITNCSHMDGGAQDSEFGSAWATGQAGFSYYNNTSTETSRPVNAGSGNGTALKTNWVRALKIYNNTFTKLDDNATSWHFFHEHWHFEGECEMYGNTFNGSACVDIADVRAPGASAYGLKVHHNSFLVAAQAPTNFHGMQSIDFEEHGAVQSVYVYDNHFKNVNTALQFDALGGNSDDVLVGGNVVFDHIYVYYNLFENVGASNSLYYAPIVVRPEGTNNIVFDSIYLTNNTIISGASPSFAGIWWETGGTHSNIFITNNIIRGASTYPIYFYFNLAGTLSNVSIEKNLYYQNGTDAVGYFGGVTPSGLTESTPTPANPMFISSSDFHLHAGSPAIDAGKHIVTPSITSDYDGVTLDLTPEIGAFEYR